MRISPFQYASTSHSSASTTKTSPVSTQNIQVAELLSGRRRNQRAVSIKLTDECLAAINEAIQREWKIRMTVNKESIMIEVGNGTSTPTVFQCSQQNQPGAVDAIVRDLSLPSTYQTVSSLETKLIVNATEKSFAETREKVQKIAEEESRKTVKDVVIKKEMTGNKYRHGKQSAMLKPSAVFKASTVKTNNVLLNQKRISPPISASTSQVNRTSPLALPSKPLTISTQNRQELIKRPIRERVVHLLALSKYKTRSELFDRLKYEGAPKNEKIEEFLASADAIIKEISEFDPTTESLCLQPKFYKEINFRWPGLLSSEKEHLRRLIGPSQHTLEESTSIAPLRRNGIIAPVAPSSINTNVTKKLSPPVIARTVEKSSNSIDKLFEDELEPVTSKKDKKNEVPETSNLKTERTPVSFKIKPKDSLLLVAPIKESKKSESTPKVLNKPKDEKKSETPPFPRPSSAASSDSTSLSRKRVAQNLSPPDQKRQRLNDTNSDVVKNQTDEQKPDVQKLLLDLEKKFPPIQDSKKAIEYHELFESQYDQYKKCYDELTRVSKKFRVLKAHFDRASPGSAEQNEVHNQILKAYQYYQKDANFARVKRLHTELDARLRLLKKRVAEWEHNLGHKTKMNISQNDYLSPMSDRNGQASRLVARYHREKSASPGGSTTYSSNSSASTTSVESVHNAFDIDAAL